MSRGASLRARASAREIAQRESRLASPGDATISLSSETVRATVYLSVVGREDSRAGVARIVELTLSSQLADSPRVRVLPCVFAALGALESRVA